MYGAWLSVWDVVPCLVETNRRFKSAYYLHHNDPVK
jgi:hypothetical protein